MRSYSISLKDADSSKSTGDVSSRNTLEDDVDVLKSGPIRCVDVDRSGRHIITVGEDKILKLWEMEKPGVLRLMNRR